MPRLIFRDERFRPGAELFVRAGEWRGGGDDGDEPCGFSASVRSSASAASTTMDAASALAGAELRVPVETLAPLPDGAFYRHDLIGCAVETDHGAPVGVVTRVEGDIGGSRLVVGTSSGEVLVPLAVEICPTIDPAAKRIVIDPPDGLLELNK